MKSYHISKYNCLLYYFEKVMVWCRLIHTLMSIYRFYLWKGKGRMLSQVAGYDGKDPGEGMWSLWASQNGPLHCAALWPVVPQQHPAGGPVHAWWLPGCFSCKSLIQFDHISFEDVFRMLLDRMFVNNCRVSMLALSVPVVLRSTMPWSTLNTICLRGVVQL